MADRTAAVLALLDTFDWDAWADSLDAAMRPLARDLVLATGARVAADFSFDDPFVQEWFTPYVGERIVQIEGTTRQSVIDLIRREMAGAGAQSPNALAELIATAVREQFAGYETWRALRVARTETGTVGNVGTVLGAKQAGFDRVDVFDGDQDEPCASANGAVWTLDEALAKPLGHPNCLVEGTPVTPLGRLCAGMSASYRGPIVELRTSGGHRLTVTPNHPVLTGRGWIPAQAIQAGDQVISHLRRDDALDVALELDLDDVPASVEQIVEALRPLGTLARITPAGSDFHGDGGSCQGEVEVVDAYGRLTLEAHASVMEQARQGVLVAAGVQAESRSRGGLALSKGDALALAASSRVGGADDRRVIVTGPQAHARFPQAIPDAAVADAAFLRQLQRRLAAAVALDQVVDVRKIGAWVGHVYDLSTTARVYFAGGLLVHNCVRSFSPHVD